MKKNRRDSISHTNAGRSPSSRRRCESSRMTPPNGGIAGARDSFTTSHVASDERETTATIVSMAGSSCPSLSQAPATPAPASVPTRFASPRNPDAWPRFAGATWSGMTPWYGPWAILAAICRSTSAMSSQP